MCVPSLRKIDLLANKQQYFSFPVPNVKNIILTHSHLVKDVEQYVDDKDKILYFFSAVSYTHLDVYKRQVHGQYHCSKKHYYIEALHMSTFRAWELYVFVSYDAFVFFE